MYIPSPNSAQIRFYDDLYRPNVAKANIRSYKDELDRGELILSNESQCVRYFALYGGHHYHKLRATYKETNFDAIRSRDVEIIDWGCGQALATCVLIDYLVGADISFDVPLITLVEPSMIALQRGQTFILNLFQNNLAALNIVRAINKTLDEVLRADFISSPHRIKIHLFSNILDVEGFDLTYLYKVIECTFRGTNRFICVSPKKKGSDRIDQFFNFFHESRYTVKREFFTEEPIYGEVFYVKTQAYQRIKIERYERQFTVDMG